MFRRIYFILLLFILHGLGQIMQTMITSLLEISSFINSRSSLLDSYVEDPVASHFIYFWQTSMFRAVFITFFDTQGAVSAVFCSLQKKKKKSMKSFVLFTTCTKIQPLIDKHLTKLLSHMPNLNFLLFRHSWALLLGHFLEKWMQRTPSEDSRLLHVLKLGNKCLQPLSGGDPTSTTIFSAPTHLLTREFCLVWAVLHSNLILEG